MESKRKSSGIRGREAVYCAMQLIRDNGGIMRQGEIVKTLRPTFPANDYERSLVKSGYERWDVWLGFYSIDAKTVGWLEKTRAGWRITPEGEKALEMPIDKFVVTLKNKYREKIKSEQPKDVDKPDEPKAEISDATAELTIERARTEAVDSIRRYIVSKSPYQFQDIVAALLRAMGYHTPFIAPKGPDGGVDIIAFTDPLGASGSQLKVQVKHIPEGTVGAPVLQQLGGTLVKDSEVGVVVTSGTFSPEAKRLTRTYHKPLRIIDFEDFLELWEKYYPKMSEDDKALLPIEPVYFINLSES